MTSSIRIITTSSIDSFPSILLSPAHCKDKQLLINCGEGTQRSFLEHNNHSDSTNTAGTKLKGVDTVLLTQASSYEQVGGLPGFILTSADANSEVGGPMMKKKNKKGNLTDNNNNRSNQTKKSKKRKRDRNSVEEYDEEEDEEDNCDLKIIGPRGTCNFLSCIRHFVRRDHFRIKSYEGYYSNLFSAKKNGKSNNNQQQIKLRKTNGFYIQSIPITSSTSGKEEIHQVFTQSFILSTPRIQGKFLVEKAKALGIPPGKIYAKLKKGGDEPLSFISSISGKESEVYPKDVVLKGCNGVAVILFYIPNIETFEKLRSNQILDSFRQSCGSSSAPPVQSSESEQPQINDDEALLMKNERDKYNASLELDCILHLTPHSIFQRDDYKEWMNSFGTTQSITSTNNNDISKNDTEEKGVQHIFIPIFPSSGLLSLPTKEARTSESYTNNTDENETQNKHSNNNDIIPENDDFILLNNADDCETSANKTGTTDIKLSHKEQFDLLKKKGPFHSAYMGAMTRHSLISKELYLSPYFHQSLEENFDVNNDTKESDTRSKNGADTKNTESNVVNHEDIGELPVKDKVDSCTIEAFPGTEYILIPRRSKGLAVPRKEKCKHNIGEKYDKPHFKASSQLAKEIIISSLHGKRKKERPESPPTIDPKDDTCENSYEQAEAESKSVGELVFTGTGSALPCKHRNVTGNYLRMNNGNAMLLDVGEGTVGQLLRGWIGGFGFPSSPGDTVKDDAYSSNNIAEEKNFLIYSSLLHEIRSRLIQIKAIWISHPHADHHLGLIRFLIERKRIILSMDENFDREPPILIAPISIFKFLEQYADTVNPFIHGSYQPLDCRHLLSQPYTNDNNKMNGGGHQPEKRMRIAPHLAQKLYRDLGITSMKCVFVQHCKDAYAVVISSELCPFGKTFAFSGDCRPSTRFAQVARTLVDHVHDNSFNNGGNKSNNHNNNGETAPVQNTGKDDDNEGVDLLLHEATFEDGMEEEAVLKRHSTVSEAIHIGKLMKAKTVVLTHFSQRYPKIPAYHHTNPKKKDVNVSSSQEEAGRGGGREDPNIIFAFDFMRIQAGTTELASRITPALRLLHPETAEGGHEEGKESSTNKVVDSNERAKQILSQPGLFANLNLL